MRRTVQEATGPKWHWEVGWAGFRGWYGNQVKLSFKYDCDHCRVRYSLAQLRRGIPGDPVSADESGGSPVFDFSAKEWNRGVKLFCGVGILLMLIGAAFAVYRWNYLRHAITTKATITNLIERKGDSGQKLFAPVYVFTDQRGESVEVTSSTASSLPHAKIGGEIEVFYDPDNPKNSIENSFFDVTAKIERPFILIGRS